MFIGDLPLFYRISNHVSEKEGNFTVNIVTPIIDYECFSYPKAGSPGRPSPNNVLRLLRQQPRFFLFQVALRLTAVVGSITYM